MVYITTPNGCPEGEKPLLRWQWSTNETRIVSHAICVAALFSAVASLFLQADRCTIRLSKAVLVLLDRQVNLQGKTISTPSVPYGYGATVAWRVEGHHLLLTQSIRYTNRCPFSTVALHSVSRVRFAAYSCSISPTWDTHDFVFISSTQQRNTHDSNPSFWAVNTSKQIFKRIRTEPLRITAWFLTFLLESHLRRGAGSTPSSIQS